jgi:DNA uptake protein ComE-like DNA-binding protein
MTIPYKRKEAAALLAIFAILTIGIVGARFHFAGGRADAGELRYKPDLNSATEEDFLLLPEVGPRRAKAIIQHRQTKRFAAVDELADVRFSNGQAAFTPERIAKLRGRVTVTADDPRAGSGNTP